MTKPLNYGANLHTIQQIVQTEKHLILQFEKLKPVDI